MNARQGRSTGKRIGITLLNLWAPGLGILRTGPLRSGIAFLLLPSAAMAVVWIYFAAAGAIGFAGWATAMALLILTQLGAWIGSIIVTWRRSRERSETLPAWSRWYAILAAAIAAPALLLALNTAAQRQVRHFHISSEAMMPGLVKDDRLIASMRGPGELRRGDIILFRMPGSVYIKRVAALPGDRIAMRGGVVILNGRAVPQRFVRDETISDFTGRIPVKRLAERFPGEVSDHEIYDSGPSEFDEMEERTIPSGRLFVMGDHRDRTADSRVSREQMGVELLPVSDVLGKALFRTWGPSRKFGQPLPH